MTAHSQMVVESIYSATFAERYMDAVENLPDDVQRHLTQFCELDNIQFREFGSQLEDVMTQIQNVAYDDFEEQSELLERLYSMLIVGQNVGDEKLAVLDSLNDMLDEAGQTLEQDLHNIDCPPVTALSHPQSALQKRMTMGKSKSPSSNGKSGDEKSCNDVTNGTSDGELEARRNQKKSKPSTDGIKRAKFTSKSGRVVGKSVGGSHGMVTHHKAGMSTPNKQMSKSKVDGKVKRRRKRSIDLSKRLAKADELSDSQNTSKSGHSASPAESSHTRDPMGRRSPSTNGRTGSTRSRPNQVDIVDIDPDEPTYCLCDQVSYGDMIGCDNDLCPIEWFHFNCVQLTTKPKGKWFCPKCRQGDKANVMRPKAQFLRELERYNREREEKLAASSSNSNSGSRRQK